MEIPVCSHYLLKAVALLVTFFLQAVCMESYRDYYTRTFSWRIPGPPAAPPIQPAPTSSTLTPSSSSLSPSSLLRRPVLPSLAEVYLESMTHHQPVLHASTNLGGGHDHVHPVRNPRDDLPKSALAVLNGDPDYTMFRQVFLRQMCQRLLAGSRADAFQFCFNILSFGQFSNNGVGPPVV